MAGGGAHSLAVVLVRAGPTLLSPYPAHTAVSSPTPHTASDVTEPFLAGPFPSHTMANSGTCKKWLSDKGFGFIEPADGGEDLFVHQSELYCEGFRCLTEGDAVEYEISTARGKPQATNVTGPGGAPIPPGEGGKGGGGKGKGKGDGKGKGKGKGKGGDGCFNCGSSDHWSRDCPDGKGGGGRSAGGGGDYGGGGGSDRYAPY